MYLHIKQWHVKECLCLSVELWEWSRMKLDRYENKPECQNWKHKNLVFFTLENQMLWNLNGSVVCTSKTKFCRWGKKLKCGPKNPTKSGEKKVSNKYE
jgi:hypothetical protein